MAAGLNDDVGADHRPGQVIIGDDIVSQVYMAVESVRRYDDYDGMWWYGGSISLRPPESAKHIMDLLLRFSLASRHGTKTHKHTFTRARARGNCIIYDYLNRCGTVLRDTHAQNTRIFGITRGIT